MRKYNSNASIIRAIENLYDKAQSAVLFNGSTGEWFRTTVWVRQGCRLSPTLFNIFLERIISEAMDDHEGSVISNEGSKPEILSRIAQTTPALSRLKNIWKDKNISLASKVKLMRTLILSTFLYACESWTLTAEIERRIQALEMRCFRRLLNISYKDHVTNEEVCNRIKNATGVHDDLLTMVKKPKLRWYGHISRASGIAKTIVQGTVKGARRRGRQKKRWEDNIK